jgi:hypothetical protein
MRLPKILRKDYRGPVVMAAVVTFVAWNAFGFGWFGLPSLGFVTAGGAAQIADTRMEAVAVPLAAELCAIKFNAQAPNVVAAKTAKLQAASYSYARSEQLDKSWITLGKARDTNQRVVDACAELILAAPAVQKSADATK